MACQFHLPPGNLRRRAGEIKLALKHAGFTLAQISDLTSHRYGKTSPYFLPPTFLYKLAMGVTPHVCQIAALSTITRRRFTDWMADFGFDLTQIPRRQTQMQRKPTLLVTPERSFPLKLRKQTRTSGRVDFELGGGGAGCDPAYTVDSGGTALLLHRNSRSAPKLCILLRAYRECTGLTFRSAHNMSVRIAQELRDKHCAISIGLLSDYEATDMPPRHVSKIMTLCIIYGIDFFQYLSCAGIHYYEAGKSQVRLPLAWPTRQENQSELPASLIAAENEDIPSFSPRSIAV